MGEYGGRIPVWGMQAMLTHWLRKQAPLMRAWMELPTREGLTAEVPSTSAMA